MPSTNTEPVLTAAAAHSAVIAVIGALAVFNVWHPSDVQIEAIFGAYLALAPYGAFFLRSRVSPFSKKPAQAPAVPTVLDGPVVAPVETVLP